MFNNQHSGSIPQDLGNLESPVSLSLHTNNFSGVIPRSLGGLKNLTFVYLNNNRIVGSIPQRNWKFEVSFLFRIEQKSTQWFNSSYCW